MSLLRNQGVFQTWSNNVLFGVDVRCKLTTENVHDQPILAICSFEEYEYDFILEKQIIADSYQFQKDKADVPSNLCKNGITLSKTTSSQSSITPTIMSASKMLHGEVLQPSKTNDMFVRDNTIKNNCELSSNPIKTMQDFKDFEIDLNDPFAAVELKTINEIAELEKILSLKEQSYPESNIQTSSSKYQSLSTSLNSLNVLSINHDRDMHLMNNVKQSVNFLAPQKPPTLNETHSNNIFSEQSLRSNIYSSQMNNKSLCLSSPDLQVSNVQKPCDSRKETNDTNMNDIKFKVHEQTQLEMALVNWAKASGFSIRHARYLVHFSQTNGIFAKKSLEMDKLTLLNQLRMVDLLMNEFRIDPYTLLEEYAICIAASSKDINEARRLQKCVIEMEQTGLASDAICAYIRENSSTLNHSLSCPTSTQSIVIPNMFSN